MGSVVILLLCLLAAWAQAQVPSRPKLSPTCGFMYHANITEMNNTNSLSGYYAAIYTEEEDQRMLVTNQTEVMNGKRGRHEYGLDRMDLGKEYNMTWTQGMPTDCESNDNPYVVNIWEGFDYYTYNGTQEFNGSRLEMWSLDLGGGESIKIGVSSSNRNVPRVLMEVIPQKRQDMMIVYVIENYTTDPDKKLFTVPKLCMARAKTKEVQNGRKKKVGIHSFLRSVKS